MAKKNIRGFLETLLKILFFEYYNFSSDLEFEYYYEYYPEILLQVRFK